MEVICVNAEKMYNELSEEGPLDSRKDQDYESWAQNTWSPFDNSDFYERVNSYDQNFLLCLKAEVPGS